MNKQLKKMIDHADVVSFDVFDTFYKYFCCVFYKKYL